MLQNGAELGLVLVKGFRVAAADPTPLSFVPIQPFPCDKKVMQPILYKEEEYSNTDCTRTAKNFLSQKDTCSPNSPLWMHKTKMWLDFTLHFRLFPLLARQTFYCMIICTKN